MNFIKILEEYRINPETFLVTTKPVNKSKGIYKISDINKLVILGESIDDRKNFKFIIKLYKQVPDYKDIYETTEIIPSGHKKCIDYKDPTKEIIDCFYLKGLALYHMIITP